MSSDQTMSRGLYLHVWEQLEPKPGSSGPALLFTSIFSQHPGIWVTSCHGKCLNLIFKQVKMCDVLHFHLFLNLLCSDSLPNRLFSFSFFFLLFLLSLCYLGDELECIQPSLYRNVARQLNISVAMENMVSDAFIGVATEIFSAGTRLLWSSECWWWWCIAVEIKTAQEVTFTPDCLWRHWLWTSAAFTRLIRLRASGCKSDVGGVRLHLEHIISPTSKFLSLDISLLNWAQVWDVDAEHKRASLAALSCLAKRAQTFFFNVNLLLFILN